MQSQQSAVDVAAKSARRVRPGRILFVVSPAQVAPGLERYPASDTRAARKARSRGAWLVFSLGLVLLPAVGQAQIVEWARSAGGTGYYDEGHGIAVDASGNSYVTGSFEGTATFGPFTLTSVGEWDMFVAKYDSSGNVLWVRSAGTTSGPYEHQGVGLGIAVDTAGNSYVTGIYFGTAMFGPFAVTSAGASDIFVAKYDSSGNVLWVRSAGGGTSDRGAGIVVDAGGNSYVTGFFGEDFFGTATFGPFTLTSFGNRDIFVAKYDSSGNVLWARSAGGTNVDEGAGIAVGSGGISYVTGSFRQIATFGPFTLTTANGPLGVDDVFVAKYDASGNVLWVQSAGGALFDAGNGIVVDVAGNSYVTGGFQETATFGPFGLTTAGAEEIFVAKYDNSGNVVWARSAGGTGLDRGFGIALDDAGNSFVTGLLGDAAADFGPFTLGNAGGDDCFVAEYDNSGNVVWARSAGGAGSDRGFGIALDSGGNNYVTGLHSDMATFGSFTLTSAGDHDIFVAKYNGCGNGSIDPNEACDGGLGCTDCLCGADFEPMTPPSIDCQPICGNGRIDPGEECDDGNSQPGDGCDENCRLELGACCVGTACSAVPQSDCLDWGGSFFGVDSTCDAPDADGDGLRDECDECPNDAAKIQPGICGCNVDDAADGDGDGVPDCSDECPGVDDAVFAPGCQDAIPTVSGWGLILLALLLLTGAKVCFGRTWALRTRA